MSRFLDSLHVVVVVLFAVVLLAPPFTQAFPRSDGKSDAIESRSSPKAVLDYGTFVGGYNATYDIAYFKSIPFAAPPVGELRYRAPQPPLRYKDEFDATVTKDFCVQRTVNGSEDCLYLEIYGRPFVKGAKKPVVVSTTYFRRESRLALTYQTDSYACAGMAIWWRIHPRRGLDILASVCVSDLECVK